MDDLISRHKEPWNLGDGISNVCDSVIRKLDYALFQLDDRSRTIINVDSYEAMAMYYAMKQYQQRGWRRKDGEWHDKP